MKEEVKNIILDWSRKTGIKVTFTERGVRLQKKLERKGAYVKELNELDYDLPIVNEAIVNYLVYEKTPSETINGCDRLIDFQKVVKVSSNYKYGWHNGKFRDDKTYRVLASKDFNDSYIGKARSKTSTVEKFANTPDHCIIWNEEIKNTLTSEFKKLDKQWYINLAEKRLKDFGFDLQNKLKLF